MTPSQMEKLMVLKARIGELDVVRSSASAKSGDGAEFLKEEETAAPPTEEHSLHDQ